MVHGMLSNENVEASEGMTLLILCKGRAYDAQLRAEIAALKMKRLTSMMWLSVTTGSKFELTVNEVGEERVVTSIHEIEKGGRRVRIIDPNEVLRAPMAAAEVEAAGDDDTQRVTVHHRTLTALNRQREISDRYLLLIDVWNRELQAGSDMGKRIFEATGLKHITPRDFLVLPNPVAPGSLLFGVLRTGVAAGIHAWLSLPDGQCIVPTDGSDDEALESLRQGVQLHQWENETLMRPTHAGKVVVSMLNNSRFLPTGRPTSYVSAMASTMGKVDTRFTRNEYLRDEATREICLPSADAGLAPIEANIYDCLASMLCHKA